MYHVCRELFLPSRSLRFVPLQVFVFTSSCVAMWNITSITRSQDFVSDKCLEQCNMTRIE